jgi:hypothetical protein
MTAIAKFTISRMPQEPRSREAQIRRARFLAGTLGALLLIAMAAIAWAMWPEHLPRPDGDPIVIAKFAATPTFARLPREKQDPYIDHMIANFPQLFAAAQRGEFTPTEQRKAFDNVFGSRATRHVEEYFALPDQEARKKYIDEMINMQEREKFLFSAVRSAGGGSGDRWLDPARVKERVETMPPGTRTQFAEFAGEMRKRRKDRGLSDGSANRN